jgi:hypothetical protein
LERAITSFLLTGSDNFLKLVYSVNKSIFKYHPMIPVPMLLRQLGRSYLGVLNFDSGSASLLDTPFSDLYNVVSIRMTEAVCPLFEFLFHVCTVVC